VAVGGAANSVLDSLPGASKPTFTRGMGFIAVEMGTAKAAGLLGFIGVHLILPDMGGSGEYQVGQGIASGTATMDSKDAHGINARGQGTAKGVRESGMTIDKKPVAGELETGKGSQVSDGGAAGARQDGTTDARIPVASRAVGLVMGAGLAATHFGTYGGKDTQMQVTAASPRQAQDPIQMGTGAKADLNSMEGCSLDTQMNEQGNIRSAKQDDIYGASNIVLPCPGS
jgi:hypothetical protein